MKYYFNPNISCFFYNDNHSITLESLKLKDGYRSYLDEKQYNKNKEKNSIIIILVCISALIAKKFIIHNFIIDLFFFISILTFIINLIVTVHLIIDNEFI